jgi:hypothetical protein
MFNEFLKYQKLRPITINRVGKLLRDEGFEIGSRKFEENGNLHGVKSIIGLKVKHPIVENGSLGGNDEENEPKPPKLPDFPTGSDKLPYGAEVEEVL